jgi:hypothetical protein
MAKSKPNYRTSPASGGRDPIVQDDPLGGPSLTLEQRRSLRLERDSYRLYVAKLAGEITTAITSCGEPTPDTLESIGAKISAIDEALIDLADLMLEDETLTGGEERAGAAKG